MQIICQPCCEFSRLISKVSLESPGILKNLSRLRNPSSIVRSLIPRTLHNVTCTILCISMRSNVNGKLTSDYPVFIIHNYYRRTCVCVTRIKKNLIRGLNLPFISFDKKLLTDNRQPNVSISRSRPISTKAHPPSLTSCPQGRTKGVGG